MYIQKVISKKLRTNFFVVGVLVFGVWFCHWQNSRIRIRIRRDQKSGSADPDPYKNFMDPEHWLEPLRLEEEKVEDPVYLGYLTR